MSALQKSVGLIIVGCWVAVFQFGPGLLGLDQFGQQLGLIIPGLVSPLAAALTCYLAAGVSEGADRKAWRNFGTGSLLYFFGNACYVYFSLYEIDAPFPTLPELSFFLMAVFFTIGMFQYGAAKHLITRIQTYNFGLIFSAVAIAGLFLLHANIMSSRLTVLGTGFAFTYPVLWFSVAGFGLVCLLLYAHDDKRFTFALLLLAIFLEATADFLYGRALMDGTYQVGGLVSGLWMLSTPLIVWAAVEQMHLGRFGSSLNVEVLTLGRRRLAEATVPAAAVAAALLSAIAAVVMSGYGGLFLFFATPVVVLFSGLIGVREHWALSAERDLRDAARRSELELATSRQSLSSVLESTTDIVLVVDRDWRIVFFNQKAAELLGSRGNLLIGAKLRDCIPDEVGSGLDERLGHAFTSGLALDFEYHIPTMGVWLEVHAFPSPDGLSIFFRDISEARRIREENKHLAHHDPLTGLANRLLFHDELRKAVASGLPCATLFLDLDHFKEINDTLGHPVGDALLRQVAARLSSCVRLPDMVGRLGGDEFAILQGEIASRSDTAALAQRILDDISAPYLVDGVTIRVGASIGIALAPGDAVDPDQIFKNADIALYSAKAAERGTYRFFEADMEQQLQTKQRMKLDLTVALARSEFELVYQPIIDLHTNKMACFEALLRWQHPVHGSIPPSIFIPIAEETGLIVQIGEWVLEQACVEAGKWPDKISVAVNLSTVQFGAGDLPEMIGSVLAKVGLPPERLELEITESVLLSDSDANLRTLQQIRALGVRIALDDFGTGFASLGYLQKFPFSRIKIDRSFISDLPNRRESHAIVVAVTGLGRTLDIRITAEGVETRQQLDRVRDAQCDEAQGYFFSRPIAAGEIPNLLEKLVTTQKFWGAPNPPRPLAKGPELPLAHS